MYDLPEARTVGRHEMDGPMPDNSTLQGQVLQLHKQLAHAREILDALGDQLSPILAAEEPTPADPSPGMTAGTAPLVQDLDSLVSGLRRLTETIGTIRSRLRV